MKENQLKSEQETRKLSKKMNKLKSEYKVRNRLIDMTIEMKIRR